MELWTRVGSRSSYADALERDIRDWRMVDMDTISGLETLIACPSDWVGAKERVGLLSNPTGVDRQWRSTVDLLAAHPDINLAQLFGPEHGIRGDAQAGIDVEDSVDDRTGLPAVSLYNAKRLVAPNSFDNLDVVIIDLQDVGTRFYTYLASANQAAASAGEAGVRVAVLDRPNPISWMGVFGNRVEPDHESLVGLEGLPVTHAATIGEVLTYLARRNHRPVPDVVPIHNWSRTMRWEETRLPWVSPSPNLPTVDSAHLYPVTCWIEGTSLSEGRGTTRPFEIIGSPAIDGYTLAERLRKLPIDGYAFRPTWFQPTFSKHAGERCHGVQIHRTGGASSCILSLGPHLLAICREIAGTDFQWTGSRDSLFIDRLAGSSELRTTVETQGDIQQLLDSWKSASADYVEDIAPDLLYGPMSTA